MDYAINNVTSKYSNDGGKGQKSKNRQAEIVREHSHMRPPSICPDYLLDCNRSPGCVKACVCAREYTKKPPECGGRDEKKRVIPRGLDSYCTTVFARFDKVFVITSRRFWAQGCNVTTTASPESP